LPSGRSYYIYRKWGRIGTTQGNDKLEDFGSKAEAIELVRCGRPSVRCGAFV
jgi:predicted DNA-binding WGR domain protein